MLSVVVKAGGGGGVGGVEAWVGLGIGSAS